MSHCHMCHRAVMCSVEDVLVSRTETIFGVTPGAFEYGDILAKPKQAGRAMNFFWQHTPQVPDRNRKAHSQAVDTRNTSMLSTLQHLLKPAHRSPVYACM